VRYSLCFVLAGLAISVYSASSAPLSDLPASETGITSTSVPPPATAPRPALVWQTDYQAAILDAVSRGKYLAVFFYGRGNEAPLNAVAAETFARPELRELLSAMVRAQVSTTASIRVEEQDVVLLAHAAFGKLEGRPGLAILDLADSQSKRYGAVVVAIPLKPGVPWDGSSMAASIRAARPASSSAPVVSRAAYIEPARPKRSSTLPSPARPSPAGSRSAQPAPVIFWHNDYMKAMDEATKRSAMLTVFFPSPTDPRLHQQFEQEVLGDPDVRRRLAETVCVKAPLDAKIKVDGQQTPLLSHSAFAEMLGQPGLAMIDLRHKESKLYGQVVSVFPFLNGQPYTVEQVQVMLGLPEATLTQRTLIYAVSIHPEHPASVTGRIDANLLQEAESHSEYQARIRLQGHHAWESRFHRINAMLGEGLLAREVCAESWPGQSLLESAIECVRCWRLSSGHWSAVSGRQDYFGYDIKCGANGIWYATGIFGSH
jgi:hypothetical protein